MAASVKTVTSFALRLRKWGGASPITQSATFGRYCGARFRTYTKRSGRTAWREGVYRPDEQHLRQERATVKL